MNVKYQTTDLGSSKNTKKDNEKKKKKTNPNPIPRHIKFK